MKRALFTCLAFLCMVSKGYAQDDFTSGYDDFVKEATQEYKDFRDKANSEYADFMEKAWKEYGMKTPLEHPVKKWDDPLTYDKKKAQQELLQKNKKLLDAIYAFVREYNEQNQQFDIILRKTYTDPPTLYMNPAMDITDEIIKGLNEEYASLKEK